MLQTLVILQFSIISRSYRFLAIGTVFVNYMLLLYSKSSMWYSRKGRASKLRSIGSLPFCKFY